MDKEEMLRVIFEEIDTDNSGTIDWNELKNFMDKFSSMTNKPKP
jgi:Ca2+-binding EF-hand superfamily protein